MAGCSLPIHIVLRLTIPLCGAEQDSQSYLQSASHCRNDLHSGKRCAALCIPPSPRHLSAITTAHVN